MATAEASHREFTEAVCRKDAAVIRQLCESNYLLAANVLTRNWVEGNPHTNWEGKPFDWHPVASRDGKHHFEDWYDRIRAAELNMILAARKHTKTTFADTLMIWKSEFVPGHQSLYWANTENQVEERMEELEEIVDANSNWLSHVGTDNALKRKQFDNGARILTTWVQGAFEGGHVDLMIGDDPMKEFADIPDERIEAWYGRVIVPTINVDGMMAIIGTRKRPNDLYELLRTKHEHDSNLSDLPNYTLTEYPAIREAWQAEYDRPQNLAPEEIYSEVRAPDLAAALDLPGETLHVLWPEARPPEWLAKNLGGQGTPYFLREFCMIFTQAEDAVVHREWIDATAYDRVPPQNLSELFTPVDYPDAVTREAWDEVVVGIDPAGKGRDRFGFVTVGQLSHPAGAIPGADEPATIRHILDVYQAQDVPPSAFRSKMTALFDRYSPDVIALESNLNQTWVADDEELPQRVRNAIDPIATGRSKHSWKDGVPKIGSDIEAGQYRFYVGEQSANMTGDLITALSSIQMHDGELVGHTPDLVMALYMAHKGLSDLTGGLAVSRTNLKRGSATPEERERAESEQEKKRALSESEVGRAILDSQDSGPYG